MNSDNLSDEQKEAFEEQLEDIDSKALLAGIHSELMQIRMLLQDTTESDSEATEAVYVCNFCDETLPESKLEAHAVESHKAPSNMGIENLGTRK